MKNYIFKQNLSNMKLKHVILQFFIGMCFVASAQDVQDEPVQFSIYTNDGEVSTFKFEDNPKIEVKEGQMVVSFNSIEVSFDYSNLQKMVYQSSSDVTTGVASVLDDQPVILLEGDEIKVNPLQKDAQISIYDTTGVLVESRNLKAGESHKISVADLSRGIYIITLNNTTYKILKK